jgi:hypothetical protein
LKKIVGTNREDVWCIQHVIFAYTGIEDMVD